MTTGLIIINIDLCHHSTEFLSLRLRKREKCPERRGARREDCFRRLVHKWPFVPTSLTCRLVV